GPSRHRFSHRSLPAGRHPQAKSSSGRGFAPHCGNARVGYQGLRITSSCSLAGKSPDGKGIPSGQIEPAELTQTAGLERRGKKIRERTGTTRRCHRRSRQDQRWNALSSVSGKHFVEAEQSSEAGKVAAAIFATVEGHAQDRMQWTLAAIFICFAEREIGVKQATELLQKAAQTA